MTIADDPHRWEWRSLFERIAREAENVFRNVRDLEVAPPVAPEEIREHLARYDFSAPVPASALLDDVSAMLRRWTTHVTHPRYFGLFNPSVRPIAVAADALVAAFNPQLATWSHAPAANEIERHVLRFLLSRIGFDPDEAAAHFTTGGQEANQTAVVVSLMNAFPEIGASGLRSVTGQPVLYASTESHHSFYKIAQASGLGRAALRLVPTDETLRMDVSALERTIASDRRQGLLPFLVIATAGTTGAGVIDPIAEVARVCEGERLWLHVDAAWGGGALLSRSLRPSLDGIEKADSVTWDAHKWLSVPLGAGMFFCRRPEWLARSFAVSASSYVPPSHRDTTDNYVTTIQWTRRFIGLKLFLALAELGAAGYEDLVDHQAEMGERLREKLRRVGWSIVNETPLPLVCFAREGVDPARVASRVNGTGKAWISEVTLGGTIRGIRACITSYRTKAEDVDLLVSLVEAARKELGGRDGARGAP